MAKKKKRKGKVPAHLRPYLFTSKKKRKKSKKRSKSKKRHHQHKEHHVAKRKKKHSGGKRRHGKGARRRSRRSHGFGGIAGRYGTDLGLVVGGLAVGAIEKKMKTDDSFFLNKLPTPIDMLGRTGNLALATYLAAYVAPAVVKPYLRIGARSLATVAAYQLARKGEGFKTGNEFFSISGFEDADEHSLDGLDMDALADEMSGHAHGTLSFDAHTDDDGVPVHPDDGAVVPAG